MRWIVLKIKLRLNSVDFTFINNKKKKKQKKKVKKMTDDYETNREERLEAYKIVARNILSNS